MPFLGLLLVGIVASGLVDVFPPFFRFFIVFAVFSYVPGEALIRRVLPEKYSAAEIRVPLSTITGLSGFVVVSWLCGLLGIDFKSYLMVLQWSAGLVFAVLLWFSLRRRPVGRTVSGERRSLGHVGRSVALLAVALCISLFLFFDPPDLDPHGDSPVHLGYIRSIAVENRMEPEDVLAPAVFAGEKPLRGDPRMGAMHPLMAAVSTLSSLEPVDVWRWLPVVLAPLSVLGFAAFALALLPSGGFVLVALALFLMFQGGLAPRFFGVIAYGQHFALVFYWVLFILIAGYARAPRRWVLGVAALACLGGSLVHVDVAIHATLMYMGVLLFYRKFGFSIRSVMEIGAALAFGVVVAGVWKLSVSVGDVAVMHGHPQGLMYLGDMGARFFVPSPAEVLRRNGLVFFVSLFLIPFLPFVGRHQRYGRYGWMNLALALPPCVIALNPFVAPMVYREASYLLHRFLLNVPAFVITALVLGSVVVWGRSGGIWRKALAALFLVVWAKPFVVSTEALYRDVRQIRQGPGGLGSLDDLREDLSDVIRLVNERLPEGSVVVSDPMTSYVLGAFSRARVVAMLGQHGNPNDRHPIERLDAVHAVMSPFTDQVVMTHALRRFGVDYVVVNGALRAPYHDFLSDWDPAATAVVDEKIGSFSEVFSNIYRKNGVAVYRVLGTDFLKTTWDPLVPFTWPGGGGLDECGPGGAKGTVRVKGLGVGPRPALPGERVTLTTVYRRDAGPRPPLPLSLRLRFEDRAYFERAARYPGDKYVRRFLERREGRLRRFSIDRRPFEGYFRPGEWPEGRDCYDVFEIELPMNLGETTYEVRWQLVEETLAPNFSVRDFLFNDDSFTGSPCTKVEVRRHVVR